MRRLVPWLFVAFLAGCGKNPQADVSPIALAEKPGLHNLYRLNEAVYSGSGPEGAAGFASLKELGVKTVLSVDGAEPDVEEARKQGLRYVHLPIGYDSVPAARALEIAKALKVLPGPVYVHCHHGKHRGPAAIAAALRCIDPAFTPAVAADFLLRAGTDPKYVGLYDSVAAVKPGADWKGADGSFPERNNVGDIAKSMVAIDETWDRIKAVRKDDWRDPRNDCLQLLEHYKELKRLPAAGQRAEGFQKWLGEAIVCAERLSNGKDKESAYKACAACCAGCHEGQRDRK